MFLKTVQINFSLKTLNHCLPTLGIFEHVHKLFEFDT